MVDKCVSAVIPCHNSEAWIADALNSIKQQIQPVKEIIVVDDSSTDGSVQAVKDFDPSIQIISVQFKNAAATRNKGAEAATGDYVAFLDADDMWTPVHIEDAMSLLLPSDDVAYVASAWYINHDGTEVPGPRREFAEEKQTGLSVTAFLQWLHEVSAFCNSTVVYQREQFIQCGGFDAELIRRHDFELFTRVIGQKTWSFCPVHGVIMRRDTPGSISRNLLECEHYYLRALEKIKGYTGLPICDLMLKKRARIAMGAAIRYGSMSEQKAMLNDAASYLSWSRRLFYQIARISPLGALMLRR